MSTATAPGTPPTVRWRAASLLRRHWGGELIAAVILLGILVVAALVGPLVWSLDPTATTSEILKAPSAAHPMGTDDTGRDILARFLSGARISLVAGLVVVVLGGLVGAGAGLVAGMTKGFTDNAIMRAMDAIAAFPPLILAMAVSLGLGRGLAAGVVGVALTSLPFYARLMRGDVKRIRSLAHIEAARAIGLTQTQIARRHILPHTLPTMLVQSAGLFGYAILTLAGLGFVGLGAQVPTPEWGAMITLGLPYTLTGEWWVAVFPGVGVLIAVAGAAMLADALGSHTDPTAAR